MNMLDLYAALLFASLVATSSSAIGLLSVWAGLGRGHWFMRLAAVGAVLALGIFIPAYDLVLLFFTQAGVVMLTLFVVRGISGRRDRKTGDDPGSGVAVRKARFALADLLLAMPVAGGIFAVSANVPKEVWAISPQLAILGVSLGAVTLAAAWALGRGRTLVRLAMACVLTAAAVGVWTMVFSAVDPFSPLYAFSFDFAWRLMLMAMVAAGAMIAVHLLLARTSRPAAGRGHQGAPSISTRSLLVLRLAELTLAAMIILPPAYTWYRLITPPPIPDTSLPSPNAYDELTELEGLISQTAIPGNEAPVKTLGAFVAQYGQVLDRVRRALARESSVPVNFSEQDFGTTTTMNLCRALVAEGRLAEHDGDVTHAARSYLNCVQLGQARSRGGLEIDLVIGIWCEGVGTSRLAKLHHNLSPSERHRLVENLAAIEAAREPVEFVLVRERMWAHYALGWQGRLKVMIDDITGEQRESETSTETAYLRNRAFMRLLICDLGVRTLQLENGKLPRKLSQLVPKYLPSVPEDPFSGGPLVYQLQGDGYILYSIGPNRKDDGGRPDFDNGDIVLDMLEIFDKPASSSTGP